MVVFALASMLCQAQHGGITLQLQQDLQANRWQVRRDGFERLIALTSSIDKAQVQSLLIQLRERENAASNRSNPDLLEDDDYLAYDDRLTSCVEEIAINTNNRLAWEALANMRYNPDSITGKWLATHQESLPALEDLLHSPYFPRRANAVYGISLMLADSKKNKPFTPSKYKELKSSIRKSASDDQWMVRYNAVKGLGLIGDSEDIPFLETLASTTTEPYLKKMILEVVRSIHARQDGPTTRTQ
jgi:hypothetical protein